MNPHYFMQSPLIQNLGWTLLHSIWEIAVIACLLPLARFLIPKSSPRAAYVFAYAALLLALAAPVATFVMLQEPVAEQSPLSSLNQVVANLWMSHATPSQSVVLGVTPSSASGFAMPIHSWRNDILLALHRSGVAVDPVLPWLVLIWSIGVMGLSLWNMGGWLVVRRLKHLQIWPRQQLPSRCCRPPLAPHGAQEKRVTAAIIMD